MTLFLILAAVLVAGALLLVVPPMLGASRAQARAAAAQEQARTALMVLREQLAELEAEHAAGKLDATEYARARAELEARALEEGETGEAAADLRPSRHGALLAALAVPLLAGGIYLTLGTPEGLDPEKVAAAPEHEITPEQIAQMVAQLAERLEREPDNVQGWMMLARTYSMLQDFAGAAATYDKLRQHIPQVPDVLADWADVLAGAQGKRLAGEPQRLVERALELDAKHVKSLALAGTAAYQREDFAAAAAYWERILAQVPAEEELARAIVASINEARAKAGMPPLAEAARGNNAPNPSPAAGGEASLSLRGQLSLSPALAAQAGPDDTVFVIARPPQGGMPLAALRLRVGDLPAAFDFATATRMSADPLPAQVTVVARVSKSGDATPRAGDLEGHSALLAPNAQGITLVIDRVRE